MPDQDGASPGANCLSDDQRKAFWACVVANDRDAMLAASRRVGWQDARDVFHSAVIIVLERYDRRPEGYPASPGELRSILLTAVDRYGRDCRGRGKRVVLPTRTHWGEEMPVPPGGRRRPDRPLETVFGIMTVEVERGVPDPREMTAWDTVYALGAILGSAMSDLSRLRRKVLTLTHLDDLKRPVVARILDLQLPAYDKNLQAAYRQVRTTLRKMIDSNEIPRESRWRDMIEMLEARHAAAVQRRAEDRARRKTGGEAA